MMDRRKWNDFIATLSSEEINSQLADIFAFATEYKSLLEAELGRRYSSGNNQWQEESYTEDQDDSTYEDSIIPSEEHSLQEGVQIEFAVMNKVQRAVAALTVEQLLEEMLNLDNYLGRMLPSQAPDYQEKVFARETCELRYYDMFGVESIQCPHCQTYLTPKQRFCGKCGKEIKGK